MTAQEGAPAQEPALPEVGEIRTWTDRVNNRHQGRVTAVDAQRREVSLMTVQGATATVPVDLVQPAEPDVDAATARLAAVQHAQRWLDDTLPRRLEDCVTGAWDALTTIHPDKDGDDLKLDAAGAVRDALAGLAERLEQHVAAKKAGEAK